MRELPSRSKQLVPIRQLMMNIEAEGERARIEDMIASALDGKQELFETFKNALGSPEPPLRQFAAQALGALGERRATEPLVALLSDPFEPEPLRRSAAYSLGFIGGRGARLALIHTLAREADVGLRAVCAYALGYFRTADVAQALMDTLRNVEEDPLVRGRAAESLGKIKDKRAVPVLISSLSDASPDVRFFAVRSLGLLKDPRALPAIMRLAVHDWTWLEEEGRTVREEALDAIQEVNLQ